MEIKDWEIKIPLDEIKLILPHRDVRFSCLIFEKAYSPINDALLMKEGIELIARIEYFYEYDKKKKIINKEINNNIIFRNNKTSKEEDISCLNTIVDKLIIQDGKEKLISISSENDKVFLYSLQPKEHYIALKSYVEGLIEYGIIKCIMDYFKNITDGIIKKKNLMESNGKAINFETFWNAHLDSDLKLEPFIFENQYLISGLMESIGNLKKEILESIVLQLLDYFLIYQKENFDFLLSYFSPMITFISEKHLLDIEKFTNFEKLPKEAIMNFVSYNENLSDQLLKRLYALITPYTKEIIKNVVKINIQIKKKMPLRTLYPEKMTVKGKIEFRESSLNNPFFVLSNETESVIIKPPRWADIIYIEHKRAFCIERRLPFRLLDRMYDYFKVKILNKCFKNKGTFF